MTSVYHPHTHLLLFGQLDDAAQQDALLRDGVDFFGAVRFPVVAERCKLSTVPTTGPTLGGPGSAGGRVQGKGQGPEGAGTPAGRGPSEQDDVLQCYRCQVSYFGSHVSTH